LLGPRDAETGLPMAGLPSPAEAADRHEGCHKGREIIMTRFVTSLARTGLAAVAATAFCAASVQAFDHEAYLQKLYADAKAKGQTEVTMYSNNSKQFGEIFASFEKKFGIKVKVTDMFGPPLVARLDAEYATGNIQADILMSGVSDLIVFKDRGWLEPFVPANAEGLDPSLIGPDNLWFSFAILPLGTIVNTDLVKPEDYPHTWADHVKPRWMGKIGMNNPSASSGLSQGVGASLEHGAISEDWLKQLAALKPIIAPGAVASMQMVASGQVELAPYVSTNIYVDAKAKGAPLAFLLQEDGYAALPAPVGLAVKAPRPEAAKLLLAYFMTPECQALFTKSGQPGVMPGAPGLDWLPELATYPRHVMSYEFLTQNYGPMLARNKQIFGN
jgi:iron(III) transport system substrate-binding protein